MLYILELLFYNIYGETMNENDLYKIVGKNIKKYRLLYSKKYPITQEMLAEMIGVSTSLISNLESNSISQGISIITLYKISVVLEVPISKFLEDNNE